MSQEELKPEDFQVTCLGPCTVDVRALHGARDLAAGDFFVGDEVRIPYRVEYHKDGAPEGARGFEKAGAREKVYFDPKRVKAGIATCGGISPGLNDVIRAIFMELNYIYGVDEIYGFRYGMRGLGPEASRPPRKLDHDWVVDIHSRGGTELGTSRGHTEPDRVVAHLRDQGFNIVFLIGGDGTQRAANALWQAAARIGYKLAVVGVPKTIDNDINYVYKTFGFDSAVSFAKQALDAAHVEATGHPNGIGLVKVMGRDSGFIAAFASLASVNVNFALIPEIPFDLEGDNGLLVHLERRLESRDHAVIVVAEGAGQRLVPKEEQVRDASGNLKHADIGVFLKNRINDHFKRKGVEINLKYFDPSYMLRSVPANSYDSIYASALARFAVHAAMAGKTDVMIGRRYNQYIHVPIPITIRKRKMIDPKGEIWLSVLQATGQPGSLIN